MRGFFSFSVCLAFAIVSVQSEEYTNKFDGIDVDKVLKSDRLLDNYFKCLMDKGSCSPAGAELKRLLPDALKSECNKCTDKQRKTSDKVVKYILDKKPRMFSDLEKKYDPTGVYRKREESKRSSKI